MKPLISLFFGTVLILMIAVTVGCRATYDINVNQVLQLPASAKLYTAANIWYTDSQAIDPRNIQKGEMIPFGTEIQIAEASNKEVVFRTVQDGKLYRVTYDQSWMMIPAEEYLKRYVTRQSAMEQELAMNPASYEKARRGIVTKGMTRDEVLRAWGYPLTARTPSLKADTWIYMTDGEFNVNRVIFRNDVVLEFLSLE